MKVGDKIESRFSGNQFVIEYISNDGYSFVLQYHKLSQENIAGVVGRSYTSTLTDIKRAFYKVTE